MPSLYLTKVHYNLKNAQEGGTGCDILDFGDGFECDIVNQSPWSEMFGIPIAFLGFLFYACVVVHAFAALLQWKHAEKMLIFVHFLTILSIFYSAYLFYIAHVVLDALCIFCIIMYAMNIALCISTKMCFQKTYKELVQSLTL